MDFSKSFFVLLYAASLFTLTAYIHFLSFLETVTFYVNQKTDAIRQEYDYIVVGAGSAGSVVALRLAELKDVKVLVLEAGIGGGRLLDIPIVGPGLQGTNVDWQYETVPQENACLGLRNKRSKWPMGKLIGGSSRLNNMVYSRGHKKDFENWFDSHYNYEEDILPYFKKAENQIGRFKSDSDQHSTGGPFVVSDLSFVSNLATAVLNAAKYLGFQVGDTNGEYTTRFMEVQVNSLHGMRYTTGHYLQDNKPDNLQIVTKAFVHKILFKDNFEADAVCFEHMGVIETVKSRFGIVLSAGTVGSAKILMLSGIGPKNHLDKLGLNTLVDLPVGENLQDHVTTGLDLITFNQSLSISFERSFYPSTITNFLFHKLGPLTCTGCEVIGFRNITDEDIPSLQLMLIPLGISDDGGYHFQHIMNIDKNASEYFTKIASNVTATILPIVLHPKSTGTIRLQDTNPHSKPLIDPKYLSNDYDVNVLISGIELIKQIIETEPMQKLGAKLNTNTFPGCESSQFDTKSYWECYVRHLTLTSYHPIGTCKLGSNSTNSVVDNSFKVFGTNKLFVADGSVMPSLPSGNINAPIIMVAEMAADSIKYEHFLSNGYCNVTESFVPRLSC